MEQASAAEHVLTGEEGIADDAASLASLLENAADLDPSAREVADRARGIAAEIAELARDVRSYGELLLPDPERLEAVRGRVAALKQLQRKYGPTDADVVSFLAESAEQLRTLAGADDRIAELERELEATSAAARDRAAIVTEGRTRAAPALADAVRAELEELGMPGAVFEARLLPLDEPGPGGAERAELWFSASPGQPARPLERPPGAGLSLAIVDDDGIRYGLRNRSGTKDVSALFANGGNRFRVPMITVSVGDENEVGLRQSLIVALAPRVHVQDLSTCLDHQAGVADRRDFQIAGFRSECLDGARLRCRGHSAQS